MTRGRSGLLVISVAALAALAVLLLLGTWQVQRLAWKEGLIATIEERTTAAPVAFAEAAARQDRDYVMVTATGRYEHAKSQRVYDVRNGVLGWKVLTPFKLAGGKTVWADRGFVPDQISLADGPSGEELSISAALRTTYAPQGLFTPDNEPTDRRWYWFDQTALDRAAGVMTEPGLVLQLTAPDHSGEWPSARAVSPKLSNKHFGYAMTWFALAITLLGVYIAYVLQHRRKTSR